MKRSCGLVVRILSMILVFALLCTPLSVSASMAGAGQKATSGIKAYGCDLSFWNVGGDYPDYSLVDFDALKADGLDFVILRVGFEGTSSRENTIDTAFLTLYERAKKAGLDVGVYFYALATTYEGAAEDAQWCIDLFKKHNLRFEYPIYYDIEDPGNGTADRPGHKTLTSDQMTSLCLGWAQTLEAAGYYPGVYSDYEIITKLQPSYTDLYDVWYAYVAYVEGVPEFVPEEQDHSALGGLWQYTWKGTPQGTSGETDLNVAYKDYPAIMKANGYNGYGLTWEASTSLMPSHANFNLYSYNENRESILPTYHEDGTVTLASGVNSSWAWPAGFATLAHVVDLNKTPLLKLEKSGAAHMNAVVTYLSADGVYKTVNIASLSNLPNGEFDSGDVSVTVDMADYLRRVSQMPSDGMLYVVGVTYYVMGAKGAAATLKTAQFAAPPIPAKLMSTIYAITDTFVSRVAAEQTLASFLEGLDGAIGVSVYARDGQKLTDAQTVASGMKACIEYMGLTLKEYTIAVTGDVNGDGKCATLDARAILEFLTDQSELADWQVLAGDYDQSGELSTADVREMLAFLVV